MAKVTIKTTDDQLAATIAMWFESGEAIKALLKYETLKQVAKENSSIMEDLDSCFVEWDDSEFLPNHVVNIENR